MLTDATFSFDINSDGIEEQMASLGPGKGFLALDKNDDRWITDGSELFGPTLSFTLEESGSAGAIQKLDLVT
jgi:hypothetical protein